MFKKIETDITFNPPSNASVMAQDVLCATHDPEMKRCRFGVTNRIE